jgi:RecA-family ATPase
MHRDGDVLYCALEDNERRLQYRIGSLLRVGAKMDEARFSYETEMPRLDNGAIKFLKNWVQEVKNPRLIIIDSLEKVRPDPTKNQTAYSNDYKALEQFRNFANKYHVAIVIVHHDRKANADDAFDTVSGTLGLNGAADTVIVIKKKGERAILHATGRDIPSVEKAIEAKTVYDEVMWHMLGDANKGRMSEQQQKIMEALTNVPQTPQQVAKATNMKIDNVRHLLRRMHADSTVKRQGRGQYYLDAGAWQ